MRVALSPHNPSPYTMDIERQNPNPEAAGKSEKIFSLTSHTFPPPTILQECKAKRKEENDMCNGFGGSCSWILIIILILCCCGGNNGFFSNDNCNNGCGCGCQFLLELSVENRLWAFGFPNGFANPTACFRTFPYLCLCSFQDSYAYSLYTIFFSMRIPVVCMELLLFTHNKRMEPYGIPI